VPPSALRFSLTAVLCAVAVLVIVWGHLGAGLRRSLALVTSGLGVLFLVLALGAEGQREATPTGSVLLRMRYAGEPASAAAAVPYYVLTALCLLLGTLGLAVPDRAADGLRQHWLVLATGLSLVVTALRFALEKAAAPWAWAWAAGITVLAPVVGGAFAWCLKDARPLFGRLVRALLVYGLSARAGVALMYVLATTLHLGSHYDLSAATIRVEYPMSAGMVELVPGSFHQLLSAVLLPQLLVWPVYTVLAGVLGALPVLLVLQARGAAGVAAHTEARP
jgi:hypothetical protein